MWLCVDHNSSMCSAVFSRSDCPMQALSSVHVRLPTATTSGPTPCAQKRTSACERIPHGGGVSHEAAFAGPPNSHPHGRHAEANRTAPLAQATVMRPGRGIAVVMAMCVLARTQAGGGANPWTTTCNPTVSSLSMAAQPLLRVSLPAVATTATAPSLATAHVASVFNKLLPLLLLAPAAAVCSKFARTWDACAPSKKLCCANPSDTCVYKDDNWSRCEPSSIQTPGVLFPAT